MPGIISEEKAEGGPFPATTCAQKPADVTFFWVQSYLEEYPRWDS